jgi:hypothetical protein
MTLPTSKPRNIFLCAIALALTLLSILVNNYTRAQVMYEITPVELRVGEKGASFASRLPSLAKVDRHPAGLNFYPVRWPVSAMGSVIIRQGPTRVQIANVISATGMEDVDYLNEGMYQITINSALTNSETISHDNARVKTHAYLKAIVDHGWRGIIPRNVARMRGKDMNDYLNRGAITTLDPEYVLSLNEWMQLRSLTEWEFYFDGAYLTVQISRQSTMLDLQKPGVYLLSTIIQSEAEYLRGYVEGDERPHWKDLLIPKITQMNEHRAKMETELRKLGLAIDETYVDPPLPSLK